MQSLGGVPKTSDGKPIFQPAQFRGDLHIVVDGIADDIANGVRFGGDEFILSSAIAEDVTCEWQFMEWVYMTGGLLQWTGAVAGDWLSYEVYAPSSAPAETSNPGAGAYAKLQVAPGLNMYVAPGTPGAGAADWDLNLTEKLNPNVEITKVIPVPVSDQESHNGFFDYDPDSGSVTYKPGKGAYNLFDQDISLNRFIPRMMLLNSSSWDLLLPNVKSKRILPHWKHKLTLHNSTAKQLDVCWALLTARKKPT